MLPKGAVCLGLLALSALGAGAATKESRRSLGEVARRSEAGFDPDVLNRFLEEYANKIKRTTTTTPATPFDDEIKIQTEDQRLEAPEKNRTDEPTALNDSAKRHKYYSAGLHSDDRNSGWVTLDAIPWSKSKISKWQANPTTQEPWPDSKPWDKPSYSKPWNNDFPSRPGSYESTKPWQNKGKPHWADSTSSASNKPWYSQDRPRPQQDRPSYPTIDKYEDNPSQAQKWPPERPAWDKYGDSGRPSADIITDNGPPNFPNANNWDRPGQSSSSAPASRPSYTHHTESYVSEAGGWHDRNDFPAGGPNKFGRPEDDRFYDRPHFSHYQYPASKDHPSNHPSSGDGQWVLLSTNRGYSKSRQRSIKLDSSIAAPGTASANGKRFPASNPDEVVPAVTSKRQVRLTVLPSINGTNTTTSHGGLLEVERTFKTVDQSQKEYEMEKSAVKASTVRSPIANAVLMNRRPLRTSSTGTGATSNSAVLAAVGAGMLPATMAMMIPMMLGRKKRSLDAETEPILLTVPRHLLVREERHWG